MAKPDQYADIDFEEINDQTGLANDEIKCLKVGIQTYTKAFWFVDNANGIW